MKVTDLDARSAEGSGERPKVIRIGGQNRAISALSDHDDDARIHDVGCLVAAQQVTGPASVGVRKRPNLATLEKSR